jgi:hypothetical protein
MLESRLVRFRMKPSDRELDIVFVFAAKTLDAYARFVTAGGSPRQFRTRTVDFRRLRFLDVRETTTILGPNVPRSCAPRGDTDSDWADHENNLIRPNGRLITAVDCKRRALGYHCVMAFDSFGRHSWTFQELVVDSRTANVRFRDNSWEYFDSVTGTVMNPLDPFPNSQDRDGPKSRRANR